MIWLKKAYQDTMTRGITIFLLAGGPVWSGLTYLANSPSGRDGWWQAWAFFWGFYLVIFLPALYLTRNK